MAGTSSGAGAGRRARPGRVFLTETEIEAQFNVYDDENEDDDLFDLNGDAETGWQDDNSDDISDSVLAPSDNPVDTSDSDESGTEAVIEEHDETAGPQTKRRRQLKHKLVCNLDATLNPDNYDR